MKESSCLKLVLDVPYHALKRYSFYEHLTATCTNCNRIESSCFFCYNSYQANLGYIDMMVLLFCCYSLYLVDLSEIIVLLIAFFVLSKYSHCFFFVIWLIQYDDCDIWQLFFYSSYLAGQKSLFMHSWHFVSRYEHLFEKDNKKICLLAPMN